MLLLLYPDLVCHSRMPSLARDRMFRFRSLKAATCGFTCAFFFGGFRKVPTWIERPVLSIKIWTGLLPEGEQMESFPSLLARLEIVVWSGAWQSKSSTENSERRNPSVCRKPRWKTMPTVKAVSMASLEYCCYPPGLRCPRFGGPQPLSSSSEIHTVRLPRCRSPASYSGQLVVLYDFQRRLAHSPTGELRPWDVL